MYAEILIEYPTKKIDKYFTYVVPDDMKNIIKIGMKVKVPFGNKIINGFVMNISNNYKEDYELKSISELVFPELSLNEELMNLGKYISKTTLCPLISAYQTMLPTSLKIKDDDTNYGFFKKYVVLNKSKGEIIEYLNNYKKDNKQTDLLKELLEEEKIDKSEVSNYVLNTLIDKGLVKVEKEQVYRINKSKNNNLIKNKLTQEQEKVFNTVKLTNKHEVYLLEGITGSGKTEVYLNLIDDVIKKGKTAILLVPEISLTMQIVGRLYDWFGSKVAIFHSQLSNGEKYDEYLKILRGEVKVVVGTRSAIFTPLKNIGIIIIDEEHSDTYKQENTPRYNAIDIGINRAKYHNIPIVLGTATPRLEERARAIKGVYKHLHLNNRVGDSKLPKVSIVDMSEEVKKHNYIISEYLDELIKDRLNKKEQIIILLNRRGFSTTITCSSCGYTYKCPNCDITLTYHKSSNNLRCHYCGYTKIKEDRCPNCKEDSLSYLGLGTEKVEAELKKLYPNANIIRMDQDTTTKKGAHERIIKEFKEEKYDILLGTQMISKGLDFPKVTLVGIINADATLNLPDFRSNERTFSLIYQASGRAGRSNLAGEVVIETYNPDNYILNCCKNNDFNSFYDYEMDIRKMLKYPPYYYLISLKVVSTSYEDALSYSTKVVDYLKKNIDSSSIILGPTTSNMFKLNNNYRFQVVIKYRFDDKLFNALKELDNLFLNINNVYLEIDTDPYYI